MSTFALRNQLPKYLEIARINYRSSIVHFADVLGRTGIIVLRIWIFTQLYTVTYAISGSHTVGGFTVPMTIWSLMLVQSLSGGSRPNAARIMMNEVEDGIITYSLNRPYSYALSQYAALLGRYAAKLPLNLLLGGIITYILVGPIPATLPAILAGTILFVFGATLDFTIFFLIGLCAFWMDNIRPLMWIYLKSQFAVGGQLIPLTLFPLAFQHIAEKLPMALTYYGAARIMVHFDMDLFLRYLGYQIIYIVIFAALATFSFKRVIRNLTVNGG
jgi:ABC-2 type transport system permease protein